MIKFVCDLCGNDKSRIAYNLRVSELDLRYDTNTVKVCKEKTFLVCKNCYSKLGLPNLYKAENKK